MDDILKPNRNSPMKCERSQAPKIHSVLRTALVSQHKWCGSLN